MCGRVYVKSSLADMVRNFGFADPGAIGALDNTFPRYNGAPSQMYPIIVLDELMKTSAMFVSARWGFVPSNRPGLLVNARSESVATNGMFRRAYQSRRALMPIDGFFEWKDILGTGKNKQPYALAMKSGEPFALAAIWERWRDPAPGEDIKTFCILTCPPNALVANIHDRMPVILHPADYRRWLGADLDPRDLLKPFPADLMTMWPISSKVGNPKNDTPDILDPLVAEEPRDLFT
jgi:putative SOS response-associated peptidase YedK